MKTMTHCFVAAECIIVAGWSLVVRAAPEVQVNYSNEGISIAEDGTARSIIVLKADKKEMPL